METTIEKIKVSVIKNDIKTLSEEQKFLRNQRKDVHIKGERTMEPWVATMKHRANREKLRIMFKQIQIPFEKYCPKSRINFLSYSYVLHKFCELLELDDFIKCFPLLKSREKLIIQDKIWEKICFDLRWEYIPSV